MGAKVSRRNVLRAGGGIAGAVTLSTQAGCSFLSTDPESSEGERRTGSADAKESPMLADRVEAGELPALKERLPANPLVVEPLSKPGVYGGTMRRGQTDPQVDGMEYMGWAGLAEWTPTTPPEPAPALAESWEIEDGGRTYVFHLRAGIKWSDGEPFTTDDIMYVYEHVFSNEKLSPVFPGYLRAGDEPATFVQVDQRTFRIEFAEPNGLLLRQLCFVGAAGGTNPLLQPRHYMGRFHEDVADSANLKQLMDEEGQQDWVDFYHSKHDHWLNPDLPVLGPWQITQPPGQTAEAERNPFYWRVDPDGRQLPYIDKAFYVFLDGEAFALSAANGEIDLAAWDLEYDQAPVLAGSQQEGDYRLLRWVPDGQFAAVYLNMSHPDPVLHQLFGTLEFRAGLSHAINREEMRKVLFQEQGSILHPCGQPEDPYYEEGMGQRFLEFDVDKANELLDSVGLTRRGSDGMRLDPDGRQMRLVAQAFDVGVGVATVEYLELVKQYWKVVGIDIEVKQISHSLWYDRIPLGEYDIVGYPPAGYLWDIDPLWYVPTAPETYWAPNYGAWYNNPDSDQAMEPTGDIRRTQELFDQLKQEPDDEARLELGREILHLHDTNVWIIGTVVPPFSPVVATNRLRNIREEAVASYRTGYESATALSQLYLEA